MQRIVLCCCLAGLASCAKAAAKDAERPTEVRQPAGELAGVKTITPLPEGDWTTPAGDLANTRFSPLAQLTPENVKNLKITSMRSTGVTRGHEGQPLVVKNTLYVVTPYPNLLYAVDLKSPNGELKWVYRPNPNPQAVGIACCDVVNRGAAYGDGKIVYNLLDSHVVAVDAETGKEVWRTTVGDINIGETYTMAPLIVGDRVLVGNSGGEMGVRGKLVALDLKDGHELWRAYNTGSDRDVKIGPEFHAFYPKDQGTDLGLTTWPPDQWKLGGATVWGWLSYDPELDLVYYGTANPGVWNPDLRPGDNKWSCSIIARRVKDGAAIWANQLVPHDMWDFDEIMENVLVDMEWHGKPRKLLIHPGRTGFVFVLDRTTGELLSAEPFMPINWAKGYDLKTGLPEVDDTKKTHFGTVTKKICPSSTGAKDFIPSAFSPRTGLLYIPAHNTCMDYEGVEANYIAGTPYLGVSAVMYPGPGGYQGELVAWDVAKSRRAWSIKEEKLPVYSGVLATGGDLVFYGTMDGWFRAADARTGEVLFQQHLASGIVADPITFLGPDGKQYVAVYAGIGGWMGAIAQPSISTDDPYAALGTVGAMKEIKKLSAPGDVVYVFGL